MLKYLITIGVGFKLICWTILLETLFFPSATVLSVFGDVVYYGTPLVLLAMLMRHTPWWTKLVVLVVFFVMPLYVYNNVEFCYHLKYHIYMKSVGFPKDWNPDMQRVWWKDFLWSVFWRGTFYSMLFLALFKLGRRMYLKWKTGFYYFDDHKYTLDKAAKRVLKYMKPNNPTK